MSPIFRPGFGVEILVKIIGVIVLIAAFIVIIGFFLSQSNFSFSKFFSFNFNASSTPFFPPVPGQPQKSYIQTAPQSRPSAGYTPPAPSAHTISPSEIPAGFSVSQLSPHFHKIKIGGVSPGSLYSYSFVYLYDYSNDYNERINVSGWSLKANRGGQVIPQAVDVYSPSGLTPPSDIYLKSGDYLRIYSTISPVGVDLHINKCLGYLSGSAKFNPSLNVSCPYINRSDISNFTGQCQNYILSLGNCQLPAPNPPVPNDDYSCRQFLDSLNYGGCFNKYRSDPDFFSKEWDVWTGSQFMDFQHDRILLLDTNGLLVDEYSY